MKKPKLKTIILMGVELLLLAVFIFSALMLWHYYKEGKENARLYSSLSYERTKFLESLPLGQKRTAAEQYAPFEAMNEDFAAWLTIEDTPIDYPVMQSEEPNFYLYRDFQKNSSRYGTLYLAEGCDPDRSMNLLIHGHHMKNGSMFACLTDYTSKKFYEAHPLIQFDTLKSFGTYEIIAALKVDLADEKHFPYYDFIDGTEEEFNAYIQNCKARAFYDTGVEAKFGDQLLTLSTCEYTLNEGRMLVVARRIEAPKSIHD